MKYKEALSDASPDETDNNSTPKEYVIVKVHRDGVRDSVLQRIPLGNSLSIDETSTRTGSKREYYKWDHLTKDRTVEI